MAELAARTKTKGGASDRPVSWRRNPDEIWVALTLAIVRFG